MMLFVLIPVLIAVLVISLVRRSGSGKESRYSKTGNYMDFDPGVDSDKVGDPKYPNAGIDSVMKHEFMDDVMKDSK